MTRRAHLLITLGDPCGIGPELLAQSLPAIQRWADVTVVGAKAGMDLLATGMAGDPKATWRWGEPEAVMPESTSHTTHGFWTSLASSWAPSASSLSGYATWLDPTPEVTASQLMLGQGSATSGHCAIEAVRLGAQMVMDGAADALVTLPLSKSAVHKAGLLIPGHTEFLQQLSGAPLTRMAFISPSLSVVLHTVHQSLRSVLEELSAESVAETLSFAADRFMQLTGRSDVRVALCALNPHAGEAGAFGDEESILEEAVVQAEAHFMNFSEPGGSGPYAHIASPFDPGPLPEGWSIYPTSRPTMALMAGARDIEVLTPGRRVPESETPLRPCPRFFGPLPADTVFLRACRGEFDLVVALHHDQGLIPIKVLEPARAVNVTLGLPFIRTSPDHGTAFDLAGRWAADPTNFLEASALAVRLAGRAKHQHWSAEVGSPRSRV